MRKRLIFLLGCLTCITVAAQTLEPKPNDAALSRFEPLKAPIPPGLVLRYGDRLAVCGDSITEQRMYSRLIEDYLTMCVPELNVTVRQFGWSGERAPGFLARMTNDCLRFKPTIATTCYGMNDHEYRRYEDRIGQAYREFSQAIIEAFKTNGVRVIQGSPGCVGRNPHWSSHTNDSMEDLNLNLCHLRNIGLELAEKEQVGFADVFWPMLTAGVAAQNKYGTNYAIAGHDGVHPGWAGHTVMAYAFLKAFGLKGDIGTLVVDLKKNKMITSRDHELVRAKDARGRELVPGKDGVFKIRSARYPFCACAPAGQAAASYPVCGEDDPARDNCIRSAMTLVPFNSELNRLMLVAKNGRRKSYKVTWGDDSKIYSADQLAQGINLAAEFPQNPFCAAFAKVDAAVAAQQAFETKQIKQMFRSPAAKADMERVVTQTEIDRESLAAAIKTAFVPVEHVLKIEPQ